MADCAQLEQQAQQLADTLASLTQEGQRTAGLNPTSADVALELGRSAARLVGQINTIKSQLLAVQDQQRNSACPFIGFLPQRRAADAAVSNLNSFISKAEQTAQTAKQQEEASQKATTTNNNAGTGTPNTAGTGTTATPDAAQLEEVQVTAKRKPEPLEEVQVTGVKKDTTGLEEVKVTGKRNPDELTEVQITGKRNPDELQEVTVTAKKTNTNTGVAPQIKKAQAQASLQDTTNFGEQKDWRVRLQLSPGANYLYKAQNPGILKPLADSQGVIFPYTPSISVTYAANYGQMNPVHSNYKIIQYENSSVDSISISCDFTAQDTYEANYLLAVIHFFRSATKMFYGQDENPKPGTPPPVCYLFGMGQFQFNAHPLVITSFGYNLPADVDYIRAGNSTATGASTPSVRSPQKSFSLGQIIQDKIQGAISQGIAKIGNRIGIPLTAGGGLGGPTFQESFNYYNAVGTVDPTYVPTKINLSISCMPLISRYNTSNNFSIKDYASGKLLQGTKNPSGGFW